MSFSYDVEVKPVDWKGPVVAVGTLVVEGFMRISDFKIIETNGGKFVVPPSRRYERDGETKYWNIVYFDEERDENSYKGDFEAEVEATFLDAYDREVSSSSRASRVKGKRKARREPSW